MAKKDFNRFVLGARDEVMVDNLATIAISKT